MDRRRFQLTGGTLLLAILFVFGSPSAQGPLLVDGDFELNESGKQLRAREKPQGWYESRRDKAGRDRSTSQPRGASRVDDRLGPG